MSTLPFLVSGRGGSTPSPPLPNSRRLGLSWSPTSRSERKGGICPVLRAVVGGARVPSPGCGAGGNILRAPSAAGADRAFRRAYAASTSSATSPALRVPLAGNGRLALAEGRLCLASRPAGSAVRAERASRRSSASPSSPDGSYVGAHAPSGVAPAVALQCAAVPGLSVFVLGDKEVLI